MNPERFRNSPSGRFRKTRGTLPNFSKFARIHGFAILQFEKIGRGHGLRLEKFESSQP